MKPITFTLGIKAQNSQNARLHWAQKARVSKSEKQRASLGLLTAEGFRDLRPLLRVTLVRVGPRQLDTDNLSGALKGVRDGVAARLRIDDGSPLIEWRYEQERGEYAVRVRVDLGGDLSEVLRACAAFGEHALNGTLGSDLSYRRERLRWGVDEASRLLGFPPETKEPPFDADDFARPGRKAGGE